jgi:DNA polymerase-1
MVTGNCQNLPRVPGVRECVVPREGCVFVACDYDKAELVSLAETCMEMPGVGFSRLGDRLLGGFDPHLDMGAQLLGITYDEAQEWKKVGGGVAKGLRKQIGDFDMPTKAIGSSRFVVGEIIEHMRSRYGYVMTQADAIWLECLDAVKTFRQMAKAANFGLPGGLGVDTFIEYARASYGVHLSRADAVRIKTMWHRAWPEMQSYFLVIKNLGSMLQLPISHRIRSGMGFTQMCNTPFQARTADGAKRACWEVTRRQFTVPQSALYGTHMVNFVHDELILEVPEERCHEAGMELSDVMVREFSVFHPRMAKAVRATPVAMRYWSKEAEPMFENGRLVPWGERRYLSAA